MTTPLWCLLIVMLMPIVLAGVGGYFRNKQLGTLDNDDPREQIKSLTGAGSRAYAAQQNAWEALALFTAAALTAHVLGADPERSAQLAVAFVVFRVLHGVCYIGGWATLRSLMFMGSLVSLIWLFVLGA
ncbi:MAG TPA: MAPEG family protein [Pseudomonadales bacterium]|jgi:uncharacterized MAPEG superfamily protein